MLGLDAAIERGNAYAAAGADIIFVEAPRTVEEIARHRPRDHRAEADQHRRGRPHPADRAGHPADLGYAIAIYPTTALLAAADAAIGALRWHRRRDRRRPPMATMEDFFRLVGLDEWFAVSERWDAK